MLSEAPLKFLGLIANAVVALGGLDAPSHWVEEISVRPANKLEIRNGAQQICWVINEPATLRTKLRVF